jgi:hypothetical protein
MRRFLTPWWLVDRARGGNTLSFGYAFEWPLFAGFVVFVWVKEIRRELHRDDAPRPPPAVEVPPTLSAQPGYVPFRTTAVRDLAGRAGRGADDGDPDLVAYNRYLEWLAANPDRRPGDYKRSEG